MADLPPDDQKKPGQPQASDVGAGRLANLMSEDKEETKKQPPVEPPAKPPMEPASKPPMQPTEKPSFPPMQDGEKPQVPEEKVVEKKVESLGIKSPAKKGKSKVVLTLLAVLFILASVPAAVYLVQQRQEIRKEAKTEPLTFYWDWCFWCSGKLRDGNYCGFQSNNLYAITRKKEKGQGDDAHIGGPNFGPGASCGIGKSPKEIWNDYRVNCASLQRDQFLIGGGSASSYQTKFDLKNCDDCLSIETAEFTTEGLYVKAKGYSELPKVNYSEPGEKSVKEPYKLGQATIDMASSALKFKFDLSTGESSGEINSTCEGNTSWHVLGFDPRALKITCTAEHTFPGITPSESLQVSAVVRNPVVSGDSFPAEPNPNCQKTISVTACTGECVQIKAYDETWTEITDFSTLAAGQTIYLSVKGTTDCATGFTKGRFRINGGTWQETTDQNASGEFYIEYTIPSTGSYTVEAMVYCPDLGWK